MTKEQIGKAVNEYIGYPPEMDEGIETTMRRNAFKEERIVWLNTELEMEIFVSVLTAVLNTNG